MNASMVWVRLWTKGLEVRLLVLETVRLLDDRRRSVIDDDATGGQY